ncbi:MAG: DNA-binding response regulator [Goleter apudmare HA4340-LM2]|jgi:DNA-binding NarL/FixJ family response regulator|nr:DNA-binding response regulator [Goleter apudmare HA4340-LM2]
MNQCLPKKTTLQILLVDAYDICITGTQKLLKEQYPDAKIISTQTATEAFSQIEIVQPALIIMDILLPEKPGLEPQTPTGLELLQKVMQNYPALNILVYTASIKRLGQLKPVIANHKGGFTIANKNIANQEMLSRVDGALNGFIHIKEIPDINSEFKIKPEVLKLLSLAFHEGLQDKAIAKHICVSERMVRHYWDKLQAALDIDCEELKNQGKNIRIMTKIRAREAGLID